MGASTQFSGTGWDSIKDYSQVVDNDVIEWSNRGPGANGTPGVDGASAPLDLLLTGGRVQFCPVRVARGRFEGRPCAAGEIGAVRATGDGAADGTSDTFLWAAGEASIQVRWWATPELFVDAGAGALFPAVRTRYAAAPGEVTYVVPAVTGRIAIAAGLRL